MSHFLIVKTSAIGDVIQSLHVVELLKERFPSCAVDWVAEKGICPLLRAHPLIDNVLEVDTKCWRKNPLTSLLSARSSIKRLRQTHYDALFDLQSNTKSALLTILARARKRVGYGWKVVKEKPNYLATNVHLPIHEVNVRKKYGRLIEDFFGLEQREALKYVKLMISAEEEKRLEELSQLLPGRTKLMVCFGSNWENKKLSMKTLKEFLHLIPDEPAFLFIYGNPAEKGIAEDLEREFPMRGHAVGKMSLPLWQRLMWHVDAMLTMDSASLHLCATTPTPTFSLFGPSFAEAFKPLGDKHFAYQGSCPYGEKFDNRCSKLRSCRTGACLKQLTAQELATQFDEFWRKIDTLRVIS